jgi:hypothetical protein
LNAIQASGKCNIIDGVRHVRILRSPLVGCHE